MKLIFIVLLTITITAPVSGAWKKHYTKTGISIYSRKVKGSDIREFRGTTTIPEPMEAIGEALRDVPSIKKWMHRCSESRILKKINLNSMIVYTISEFPWPLPDRDTVSHSRTFIDRRGRVIIESIPSKYPQAPPPGKKIRIKKLRQRFILEYITRGKTRVSFTLFSDPGGSIPTLLLNSQLKDYPYYSLLGLKKFAGKKKYKKNALKLKKHYTKMAGTILKARIREYIGDKKLISLLVKDRALLKAIMESEQPAEIVTDNWIKRHYKKRNNRWTKIH